MGIGDMGAPWEGSVYYTYIYMTFGKKGQFIKLYIFFFFFFLRFVFLHMQHKLNVPIAISPMWNLIYKHMENYDHALHCDHFLWSKAVHGRKRLEDVRVQFHAFVVNFACNLQYTSFVVLYFCCILWKNIMKYYPTYELE